MNFFAPFLVCCFVGSSAGWQLAVGTCGNATALTNVPSLSMSVTMVQEICWVKLDMRVALFDNQLEWLQATLLEAKCRQSDWLVVVIAYAGLVYSDVWDVINNHAVIDLLIVDVPVASQTTQIVNGLLDIKEDQIHVYPSCTPVNGRTILSQTSTRIDFRQRKTFSKTSPTNLWGALALALLSGFVVNMAIRQNIKLAASAYIDSSIP